MVRWIGFHVLLVFLLLLDLGVFHRREKELKMREALFWSAFWVGLSLVFNLLIYFYRGPEEAIAFFTGYVIEKSLSVDNIFIFFVIFTFFKVPVEQQYRVLYHGIVAAFVFRLGMILAGASLLETYEWVKYAFAIFLGFTGVKLVMQKTQRIEMEENWLIRFVKRKVRVTKEYEEGHFFVRKKGVLFATPLFLVLLAIECADVVFALDSIPAILAITTDRFVVYTSNVFALLGLRSLYFVVAQIIEKFRYLKIGLGAILLFVGVKLATSSFLVISPLASLAVVLSILTVMLMFITRKKAF